MSYDCIQLYEATRIEEARQGGTLQWIEQV